MIADEDIATLAGWYGAGLLFVATLLIALFFLMISETFWSTMEWPITAVTRLGIIVVLDLLTAAVCWSSRKTEYTTLFCVTVIVMVLLQLAATFIVNRQKRAAGAATRLPELIHVAVVSITICASVARHLQDLHSWE